ncbi:MAG: hypothetical protein HY316_06640 [Acidobacteria bacterium]|nr:hypothetical protein [Acidobacteriota bacterium]
MALEHAEIQKLIVRRRSLLLAVALLFPAASVRADTIFLKNGRSIVAEAVTETGDKLYYEGEFGRVSIPKSMVDRVEKGGAVPARRQPVPSAGVEPERQGADLPPAGIVLTLEASQMERILRDGTVDDRVLAELSSKATESAQDRQNAVDGLLLAAMHEANAKRLAEASRWAEEALRTDAFDRNALLVAAQIDLARRQYSEALQHMLVAHSMDQNSPDVLTLLGDAYYFSEGAEKAVWYWKQAQAIRPDAKLQNRIERAEKEVEVERGFDQAESYHFILSWHGSQLANSFGRQVLESLEKAYQELELSLDFSPREPVSVILYGSQQFANITRAPRWAGAVNDGKIRVPVQGLTSLTAELATVLKHELTHSFVFQIAEGRCPTWFNEGVAQLQAAESLDEFGQVLAERFAASRQIPLAELEGSFGRLNTSQAFQAYGESLAAVQMISDQYGEYQLPYLLRALRGGQNMSQALRSVLRMSYEDLDAEMAAYLARHYGK